MKHHVDSEVGVLAERTGFDVSLNSLDAGATEVVSTAATHVWFFKDQKTYRTLEALRRGIDEGVIVSTFPFACGGALRSNRHFV